MNHPNPEPKKEKKWALTSAAFELLLARLDEDRELAGAQYELLRQKLTRFFEWRDIPDPEDQVDEVLNRLARRIEAGEVIEDISGFVYGIARKLMLEHHRKLRTQATALADLPLLPDVDPREKPHRLPGDPRIDCIAYCLQTLPRTERELLLEYYEEVDSRYQVEQRQTIAENLGISVNVLRTRIHRIREKLELRVAECMARKKT